MTVVDWTTGFLASQLNHASQVLRKRLQLLFIEQLQGLFGMTGDCRRLDDGLVSEPAEPRFPGFAQTTTAAVY